MVLSKISVVGAFETLNGAESTTSALLFEGSKTKTKKRKKKLTGPFFKYMFCNTSTPYCIEKENFMYIKVARLLKSLRLKDVSYAKCEATTVFFFFFCISKKW